MAQTDREHPRYAHEATLQIRVGGKEFSGRTTNVSRGGLAADISGEVPNGTDALVSMGLVFDEETQSEPLEMESRIVWCTRVDEGWQVGIAFKPMVADKVKYLTMFLRYLDDSGPRTKQPRVERSVDDQFR
ncbi:hypothetical protein BH11MYX2_BH11MYX2_38420 [soil metagenome]